MMRSIIIISFLLITNIIAADINSSDYKQCKKISDSLKRLICYDNLEQKTDAPIVDTSHHIEDTVKTVVALAPVITSPEVAVVAVAKTEESTKTALSPNKISSGKGSWQVSVETNEEDASKNKATATLLSITDADYHPQLKIHCNGNKTNLSINWGEAIERAKNYEILIGGERFPAPNWILSKNKHLSYYPKLSFYLVKQMTKSDSFNVSILMKDGSSKVADFDTTGIVEAIAPVRSACDW